LIHHLWQPRARRVCGVLHIMASSSSDNEDEAMGGLSLKGHATTSGGLLGGDLSQLDIPPSARLCGVNLSVEDDGTKVWTVTFKAKPKTTNRKQRPAPSDGQLHRLFPLMCETKTYAWGRRGRSSLVATLACGMDRGFEISEEREYAELWMGTHPSGPSLVALQTPLRTLTPLAEMLKLNPQLAGEKRYHTHVPGLPYLFKILSVRTALSIQAHPDKALARKLHGARPDLYKDDNHKPEMAVAISAFEALCSFREASEVLASCKACPELLAVVGAEAVAALGQALARSASIGAKVGVKAALRNIFTYLISAELGIVERQCAALAARLEEIAPAERSRDEALALRIYAQYPNDVGIFCIYLLNYVVLKPGEALYLGANEPHAYLSGECAECMATSDNVVRAGCTPKFKDVDTLCSMLTYTDGGPHLVQPEAVGEGCHRYADFPAEEFMVDRVSLEPGGAAVLPPMPGVSIVILCSGAASLEERAADDDEARGAPWGRDPSAAHVAEAGAVFMVSPETSLRLEARSGAALAFRACAKDRAMIESYRRAVAAAKPS